jgi:hypothetical protein
VARENWKACILSVKFYPLKYREGSAKNLSASMKRIAAILFSLVVVYGGVAWALEKCLSHDHQHEHSIDTPSHPYSDGWTTLDSFRESSWPVVHCPPPQMRIGPAAQSGSIQLNRVLRVSTFDAAPLYKPESLTFRRGLWLDAVFRRTPISVYPQDLGSHLFFSILLI